MDGIAAEGVLKDTVPDRDASPLFQDNCFGVVDLAKRQPGRRWLVLHRHGEDVKRMLLLLHHRGDRYQRGDSDPSWQIRAVQNRRQRRDRLIDSCDFIDNLRMAENTILAETIRPFVNEINNARSTVNKGHPNLGPQFFGPHRTRGVERGRLEYRPDGLSGAARFTRLATPWATYSSLPFTCGVSEPTG